MKLVFRINRYLNMSLQPGSEGPVQSGPVWSPDSQRLSLESLLKKALHKCAYKNLTFVPDEELDRFMVPENVEEYLLNSQDEVLRIDHSRITEYVCGPPGRSNTRRTSRRIFAILLIIGEPHRIMDIIEGGIDDTDLPFYRFDSDDGECLLARNTGGTLICIQIFRAWPYVQRFALYENQWRVQAPVFFRAGRSLNSHPVHRLNDDVVFPWTEYQRQYDGNSEVVRIKIHKGHCRFGAPCENQLFALKCLKPLNPARPLEYNSFRLEVKALLKVKPRAHLEVGLLTSFEHEGRYHLLFRWADGGNLDDLWRKLAPHPGVTHRWVCWLAQQCAGLAYGLEGVHNTRMTTEEVVQFGLSQLPGTEISEEDDAGRDYGRHGDIKPQNVLWFKHDDNPFKLGVLKLADFGLTTFHHALTTQVTPNNIPTTPTYSAPEREIDEKLSRPFDIWSLGCIFLEFVTWILLGVGGLDLFSENRSEDGGSRDSRFKLDNFYRVIREERQQRAEVKPTVLRWIVDLQELRDCSPFLFELLNYIRDRMLLVDRHNRDHAGDVSMRLSEMFNQCRDVQGYACVTDNP